MKQKPVYKNSLFIHPFTNEIFKIVKSIEIFTNCETKCENISSLFI